MTARQYGLPRLTVVAAGLLCLVAGCSDPTDPDACRHAGGIAVEGGNCLVFEDGGRLSGEHATIEQVVRATLVAVRRLLPITGVAIRVGPGPAFLIPEIGVGGRANGIDDVQIAIDPDHPLLGQAVGSALFPLLAHELHHIVRWFFGSDPAVPRCAGYSVGFDLVDRFLRSHPTARASQLTREPAVSFIPASTGPPSN